MRTSTIFFLVVVATIFYAYTSEAALSRNLKFGDRGPDVRELQIALNRDQETKVAAIGPGSLGNETEFFGQLTQSAVIRLQQKYAADILTPIGLTRPTGVVGRQTRLKLQNLSGTTPTSVSSITTPAPIPGKRPEIISITPKVITRNPEEIIITGSNFTKTKNAVIASSEAENSFTNIASEDGKTIRFTFHFATGAHLKEQINKTNNPKEIIAAISANIPERRKGLPTAQIPIRVAVRNANGESNIQELLVDITSILNTD